MYFNNLSLLIEKPFYLLRPQSFSFQIVSEFIDTFVKFSNFMSQGVGLLTSCFVLRGGFLYTMIVLGGFAPFKSCSGGLSQGGWFWIKLILALYGKDSILLFQVFLENSLCLIIQQWFILNIIISTDVVAVQGDFISSFSCNEFSNDSSCFESDHLLFVFCCSGSGGCIDNI